MSDEILDSRSPIGYNDKIKNIQYHAYNHNDEVRIVIQNQDLNVLPHKSYLFIEGQVEVNPPDGANAAGQIAPNFVNNHAAFLFDEIRYELNGYPIDTCKNVGITSTLKG